MVNLPIALKQLIISYLPNSRILVYLVDTYFFIYERTSLSTANYIINRNKNFLGTYADINFGINTTITNQNYKGLAYYNVIYTIFYTKVITNNMVVDLIKYIDNNNLTGTTIVIADV